MRREVKVIDLWEKLHLIDKNNYRKIRMNDRW